jgi:hypothetical protein
MKKVRLLNQNFINYIPHIKYRDLQLYSPDYFQIYDMPDRIYLGKSSFRLNINISNMIVGSRLFIEILDFNGNPIYYSISDKIMDDRSKVVSLEIYDTTPNGIATIYIAGKCSKFNGMLVQDQTDLDTPNLLYIHQLMVVNSEITDDEIIFDSTPSADIKLIQYPLYQTSSQRESTLTETDSSGHTIRLNKYGQIEAINTSETTNGSERIVRKFANQFMVSFKQPGIFPSPDMVNGKLLITDLHTHLRNQYPKYDQYIIDGNPHLIPESLVGFITSVTHNYMLVGIDYQLPINVFGFVIDQISDFPFTLTYMANVTPENSTKEHNYINLNLNNLTLLSGYCHDIELSYKPYNTISKYSFLGKHRILPEPIFNYFDTGEFVQEWTFEDTPVDVYISNPVSEYFEVANLLYTKSDRVIDQPKFKLTDILEDGSLVQKENILYRPIVYRLECKIHSHTSTPTTVDFILDSKQIVTYNSINDSDADNTIIGRSILIDSNINNVLFHFKPTTEILSKLSIVVRKSGNESPITIEDFKIIPDHELGINPSIASFLIPIENFKMDVELEFLIKFTNNRGAYSESEIILQGIRFDTGQALPVVDKEFIGLENVDNTSDINKPVSIAQQLEFDTKYDNSNPAGYETPTQLNSRDTANRNRVNHTGFQEISTVTGLEIELNSKLTDDVQSIINIGTLDVNFNRHFIDISAQSESLTFSDSFTGPTNKEITISVFDGGITSQNMTFASKWICINGTFPSNTNKTVTIIKAIQHSTTGFVYCRVYQN